VLLEIFNNIPIQVYVIITSINFFTSSFLGTILLKKTKDLKSNRLFAYFSYAVAFWSLFYTISLLINNELLSNFFLRTCMLGVLFMPVLFFQFICSLTKTEKYQKFILFNYFFSIFLAFFIYTKLFAYESISFFTIHYWLKAKLILTISIVHFVFLIVFSYIILLTKIFIKNGIERTTYLTILIGTFIGFLGGWTNYAGWYQIKISPVFNIGTSFYVAVVTYAIINYNLMDIDMAWRRLSKNIMIFCVFFVMLFLSIITFYKNIYLSIIFIILNLFIYFQKDKVDKIFYHMFLGRYKKIWDKLKSIKIKNILDKVTILNILTKDISKELKITYSAYYELSNKYYEIISTNNEDYTQEKNKKISITTNLVEYLLEKKKYIYLQDLKKENKNLDLIDEMTQLKIDLCYPFFVNGFLQGFLVYNKKEDGIIFNKEELDILQNIMIDAELEMNAILKFKTISDEALNKYKNSQQTIFLEEIERLDEQREIIGLCSKSEKLVNRILKASETYIYLYNEIKKKYCCETSSDLIEIDGASDFIKHISYKKDLILYRYIKEWAEKTKAKELEETNNIMEDLKAQIIIPFSDGNKLLGFMAIGEKIDAKQEYTQDDYFLIKVICNKIKNIFSSIYANEKANLDSLTRLHNERFMLIRLQEEAAKSFEIGRNFAIGIFDIDNFKGINDTFGHGEGDETLKTIAEVVQSLIRPSDEVFRKGGDEFILLLRNIKNEDVKNFIKRFEINYNEDSRIKDLEKRYKRKVTISMGICPYNPTVKNYDYKMQDVDILIKMLMNLADASLYQAKKNGKAQIRISKEIKNIEYIPKIKG
jgi:diguanylate cyclase (GGDEF)-like protein